MKIINVEIVQRFTFEFDNDEVPDSTAQYLAEFCVARSIPVSGGRISERWKAIPRGNVEVIILEGAQR